MSAASSIIYFQRYVLSTSRILFSVVSFWARERKGTNSHSEYISFSRCFSFSSSDLLSLIMKNMYINRNQGTETQSLIDSHFFIRLKIWVHRMGYRCFVDRTQPCSVINNGNKFYQVFNNRYEELLKIECEHFCYAPLYNWIYVCWSEI